MSDLEPFAPLPQRNPFAGNGQDKAPTGPSALMSAEQQRALGELQAQVMLAKMYPRDQRQCMDMIIQDCTRVSLAQEAQYAYSRGGADISGPSIRLMEAIARRWGHVHSGIKEVSRDPVNGTSECIAFCWDVESGYRDERQFQVRHIRDTRKGQQRLSDERDIYELIANMGQRRKRACMEAVIPSEVVEAALEQCTETLQANVDVSVEGLKKLLVAFAEFGVSQKQIEVYIQRRLEHIRAAQYVQLRKIYASLKDGISQPGQWFREVEAQAPVAPYGPQKRGVVVDPQNPPEPIPPPTPPPAPPAAPPGTPKPTPAPEPPPAAAAPLAPPDDPPLDGGNGNGESDTLVDVFEGIVVNAHGTPIDGEVILDPLAYAQEILAAWTQSQDKDEFVAKNLAGIRFAKSCDPQADALLDGLDEDHPAEVRESAVLTERAEGQESAESGERPQAEAPAESKPADLDDKDTRMANAMIVHVSTLHGAQIIEYSKSPAVLVPIQRWQRDGKQALVDRVKAMFTKRLEETRDRRDG